MADYATWSLNHSVRTGVSMICLAVHTAEGATTAASLANCLAKPINQVSYRDVCDDSTTIQGVAYARKPGPCLGAALGRIRCAAGFAAPQHMAAAQGNAQPDRPLAREVGPGTRHSPRPHRTTSREPRPCVIRIGTTGSVPVTVPTQMPGPNFPWDNVIDKARQTASRGSNRIGDDLMSQGTWDPCTKDSNSNIIPKWGYLYARRQGQRPR
jgi:hypothetical protein